MDYEILKNKDLPENPNSHDVFRYGAKFSDAITQGKRPLSVAELIPLLLAGSIPDRNYVTANIVICDNKARTFQIAHIDDLTNQVDVSNLKVHRGSWHMDAGSVTFDQPSVPHEDGSVYQPRHIFDPLFQDMFPGLKYDDVVDYNNGLIEKYGSGAFMSLFDMRDKPLMVRPLIMGGAYERHFMPWAVDQAGIDILVKK